MFVLRRLGVPISDEPIKTLVKIIRITVLINLLLVVSEVFTEFYTAIKIAVPILSGRVSLLRK